MKVIFKNLRGEVFFKKCPYHNYKERLWKYYRLKEAKETRQRNAISDSRLGSVLKQEICSKGHY